MKKKQISVSKHNALKDKPLKIVISDLWAIILEEEINVDLKRFGLSVMKTFERAYVSLLCSDGTNTTHEEIYNLFRNVDSATNYKGCPDLSVC
ncbi:hypothetical protein CDAR_505071 [Caerostris darwini]|uniref:Uncharacterized protein n=1 Tax=Caerostris darwini TaxID=1538125 RepID=A0AAV4MET1_9ARAC|nr:hypothetical protein CDAR_505071 [Caerostris darwini]